MVLEAAGEPLRTTNRLPVTLAPKAIPAAVAVGADTKITVKCEPRIRKRLVAAIIAGQDELPVDTSTDKDEVEAVFAGLRPGALPVRLRVSGIDSLIVDPEAKPPAFDSSQIVTVP
jgi:hypothetical protein